MAFLYMTLAIGCGQNKLITGINLDICQNNIIEIVVDMSVPPGIISSVAAPVRESLIETTERHTAKAIYVEHDRS